MFVAAIIVTRRSGGSVRALLVRGFDFNRIKSHRWRLGELITGVIWASWHIVPFIQTRNTATWIIWQCAFTIIYRVMMTQIYVATDRSVFACIALHASYNAAFSLMPYYGSSYQPMYMAIVTLLTCVWVPTS